MIRSKWTDLYQELEDFVYIFGLKAAVLIVTNRYLNQSPTKFKNTILLYSSITQAMVESHFVILLDNNAWACLGSHTTADYGSSADVTAKQAIIYQQRLSSNILGIYVKNSLTNDDKRKWSTFKTSYTYNNQDDGYTMSFVIVKMVHPDTCAGLSDIKSNTETMRMPQFK